MPMSGAWSLSSMGLRDTLWMRSMISLVTVQGEAQTGEQQTCMGSAN